MHRRVLVTVLLLVACSPDRGRSRPIGGAGAQPPAPAPEAVADESQCTDGVPTVDGGCAPGPDDPIADDPGQGDGEADPGEDDPGEDDPGEAPPPTEGEGEDEPEGEPCNRQPDCPQPLICGPHGYCILECEGDRDCGAGGICLFQICESDEDHDRIADRQDNCPRSTNADQADGDADGTGDRCDNCPAHANPDQADDDGDGDGDACQDSDGDDVLDSEDNCLRIHNPGQADCDADGQGDACDQGADRDGDEVFDGCDNCPDHPNSGQQESDGHSCEEAGVDFGWVATTCPNRLGGGCTVPVDDEWFWDTCDTICSNLGATGCESGRYSPLDAECGADDQEIGCRETPPMDEMEGRALARSMTCVCLGLDGDGVGDECDNCPDMINPDQGDGDGNGIGDICDWN